MQLELSQQQCLVRDAFKGFFEKEVPSSRVRSAEAIGVDIELWKSLVELGAPLMRVSIEQGGSSASLLDAALLAEEYGRVVAPVPLLEAIVANRIVYSIVEEEDLPESIIESKIITFLPCSISVGNTVVVPGIAAADAIVALCDDQVVLFEMSGPAMMKPNLGDSPLAQWTVPPEFKVLDNSTRGVEIFLGGIEEWKMLNAAAMIGAAQKSLEMASDYAKERTAFGKPIGAYQGLAHPLADSICDIDAARLLLWRSASAIATQEGQAGSMVSQLWWFVSTACQKASRRAMRTLGGYGLTMEYDLQLFLRRIETSILLNGDPAVELLSAGRRLWMGENTCLPETGEVGIDFSLGEKAEEYANELEQFFDTQLTPALKKKAHHSTSSHDVSIHKQMAASGLVFGDWPKEAGGRGCSRYEVYASKLVFERYNWSFFMVATSSMVAAVIESFGSEHAKENILPKILAGDFISSLGFSEPGSGSDVFAGTCAAVRCESTGDWLINGQKMFTTGAHLADHVLILARTDQSAEKHRGITLFLVPLDAQGIEVHKVDTLMSERTNISYYQDVRVPDSLRIGAVNGGAAVLGYALEIEQGGGDFQVSQVRMLEQAVEWALSGKEGSRPVDNPDTCTRLAAMVAQSNAAEVLVRRNLWASQEGVPNKAWGPMSKLFATESYMDNAWELSQLVGTQALLKSKSLLGHIEQHHRRAYGTTIYAGTSEIHRSMIAEQVLGLPRTRG